jgi:hypothetical protein
MLRGASVKVGGDFVQLVLKRRDGATLTVEIDRLEGYNISVGRVGNRTQLEIVLHADMSLVRYEPGKFPQLTAGAPALGDGGESLPHVDSK